MHPWNILHLCLVKKFVQISLTSMLRSWCKCMSASPDNRSSELWLDSSQSREWTLSFGTTNRKSITSYKPAKLVIWDAYSLEAKCLARFMKKISQLKSDIRSCRCTNFSLKQASGLIRGSGPPAPRTTYSVGRGPGKSLSDILLTKTSKKWPRTRQQDKPRETRFIFPALI